jgi:hypothetical protein
MSFKTFLTFVLIPMQLFVSGFDQRLVLVLLGCA